MSDRIRARAPSHVVAATGENTKPAFAAAVIMAIDWPDKTFPRDHFYRGHDVVGWLPDFGLWRAKDAEVLAAERAAATPVSNLRAGSGTTPSNIAWNRQLSARLRAKYSLAEVRARSGDSAALDDFQAIQAATHKELAAGLVRVVTLDELGSQFGDGGYRADERFIVRQGAKVRPCENCRASGKNAASFTAEKITLAPADAAAAAARYLFEAAREDEWDFGASEDDEPDAYRNSPSSTPEYTVFYFVDVDGVLKAGLPRGLNFGLKLAVEQYCRKPALVVAFLRRSLMVPVHHYIDDYKVPEPDFCLGEEAHDGVGPDRFPASGKAMLWASYDLFGFRPLRIDKSIPWSSSCAPFVGTVTDFSGMFTDGVIKISIKEETREKARALVDASLRDNSLHPQLAGKLYGKLRWVFCLGRIAVGALGALKTRQYVSARPPRPGSGGGASTPMWRLTDELVESLQFLSDMLERPLPPAAYRCSRSTCRPTLVWADARWNLKTGRPFGDGSIGFVVKVPRAGGGYDIYYAYASVDDATLEALHALRAQQTFIHPLELLSILAPYFCPELSDVWLNADVIHFGDNEAANAVAIKGIPKARDLSRLTLLLHAKLAASATRTWIERVCSKGSISDDPSRFDFTTLEAMGAVRLSFVFPDLLAALRVTNA